MFLNFLFQHESIQEEKGLVDAFGRLGQGTPVGPPSDQMDGFVPHGGGQVAKGDLVVGQGRRALPEDGRIGGQVEMGSLLGVVPRGGWFLVWVLVLL